MNTGVLLLLISILQLSGAPQPSALFSDHAVLQRGVKVPVWGRAEPGEIISVSYRGMTGEDEACAEGRWCDRLRNCLFTHAPCPAKQSLTHNARHAPTPCSSRKASGALP